MIGEPSVKAPTVDPIVAVPMLMITEVRTPDEDDRPGKRQLDSREPLRRREAHAVGGVDRGRGHRAEPGDGVLDDRQHAIGDQRDDRRLGPVADQRHGDGEHRDRRKGLADGGDRVEDPGELPPRRAGDDDAGGDAEDDHRNACGKHQCRCGRASA